MRLILGIVLALATAVQCANLAESQFSQNDESWTTIDSLSATGSVEWSTGAISVADTGNTPWWFVAPASFVGDKRAAYNGKLTFTLGPVSFNNNGAAALVADDVVLVAKCGYSLSKKGVITPSATKTYEVLLNEDGWVDSRTATTPNVFDFLGVLNNLASIQIRGGFYKGAETTRLDAVSLSEGKMWYPCCTMSNDVDLCAKPGSPYFNPPTLNFYCSGSQKKLITVTHVFPRFARRSGGTTITVTGTNFGLAGTIPTVRVNGKPCQKAEYANRAGTVTESVTGPVQETVVTCVTPPGEGEDLGVTVEGASGPTDSPFDVRTSRNARGWDHFETTATSCINEENRGFAYAGHDFAWAVQIRDKTGAALPTGSSASNVPAQVSVDANNGDVYMSINIASGATYGPYTIDTSHSGTQDENTIACASSLVYCGFVLKFNRAGKLLWSASVDTATTIVTPGAGAGQMIITGLSVDYGGPTSVYITGSITEGSTAYVPRLTSSTSSGGANIAEGLTPTGSATATVGMLVGKLSSEGEAKWFRTVFRCSAVSSATWPCPQASISTGEIFGTTPKIATYRTETSALINQHTKGDNPSVYMIEGAPRDNGGVYVTGTISTTGSWAAPTSTHRTKFSGVTNPTIGGTTYAELGPINQASTTIGYLVKYDTNGNAFWVRAFGTTGSTNSDIVPSVAAIVANNDAVFVTGSAVCTKTTEAKAYFDSCTFKTKSSAATGADQPFCNGGARNFADGFANGVTADLTLSRDWGTIGGGGSATVGYIVAYSAAGKVKWLKDTIKDDATGTKLQNGDSFTPTALAFMRPLSGNAALTGHDTANHAHESLEGRDQADMGTSFADGFYLYVGGSFTFAAATGRKVLGKQLDLNQNAAITDVFLFKLVASTGAASWVANWGVAATAETVTGLAADTRTGHVYMTGLARSNKGYSECKTTTNDCGDDVFNVVAQGLEYRAGCMPDPRQITPLANKEWGRSRCKFTAFIDAGSASPDYVGYIIKVGDEVLDSRGRVVASSPVDAASGVTALPSVQWVKSFGLSQKGSSQATAIAVADSNLYVVGNYAGQTSGSFSFPNLAGTYGAEAAAEMLVQLTE